MLHRTHDLALAGDSLSSEGRLPEGSRLARWRHRFLAAMLLLCAAWLPVAPALAQFSQQGPKLVGTGALGAAQQGDSVSISADGNTAIVGGHYDNGGAGAAWVYTRSAGVWSQQGAKLVGTGAVGAAYQGYSVSISGDGNTAIVGGYADNGTAGAAWVYTRSAGVWSQQGAKLVGTGTVGTANQGRSVALSADGNSAIVGGYNDNGGAGAAWVYTRSAGVWSQQGAKLVGTGAVGAAYRGYSVSISADGNTAIVGGPIDNGSVGAAWVWAAPVPVAGPVSIPTLSEWGLLMLCALLVLFGWVRLRRDRGTVSNCS